MAVPPRGRRRARPRLPGAGPSSLAAGEWGRASPGAAAPQTPASARAASSSNSPRGGTPNGLKCANRADEYGSYRNARFTIPYAPAATNAAAGIVMNQPMTMFLATPQRTAFTRFVAPTPMMAEVMTWVVEMGALKR